MNGLFPAIYILLQVGKYFKNTMHYVDIYVIIYEEGDPLSKINILIKFIQVYQID